MDPNILLKLGALVSILGAFIALYIQVSKKNINRTPKWIPIGRLNASYKKFQQMTSFNQGAFIQYSFLANQYQSTLKQTLISNSKNKKSLTTAIDTLTSHLNHGLNNSLNRNIQLLEDHFHERNKKLPIISIKLPISLDGNTMIVPIVSNSLAPKEGSEHIDTNTGYFSIYQTGRHFMNNNIEKSIKEGSYLAPSLDIASIRLGRNVPSYQSTLIAPITLLNNDLSQEFINSFGINNVDRTIFGFLCIDHIDVNYFGKNDVPIINSYADMMSLFLVTKMMHTVFSQTYNYAEELIKSQAQTLDNVVSFEEYKKRWKREKLEGAPAYDKDTPIPYTYDRNILDKI